MRLNFNPVIRFQKILALRFLGATVANVLLLIPVQSAPPIHLESAASPVPRSPSKISSPVSSAISLNAAPAATDYLQQQRSFRQSIHSQPESAAQIRVQVARSASEITIAASTTAVIRDRNRHRIARLEANQLYSVLAGSSNEGLRIGMTELPNEVWIDPGAAAVWVEGRWYEGQLQLVNTGGELLAINRIDVERYLYSVVGSEMYATWQFQALKAQAVAARSYAMKFLENPVNAWFDIGSDEAFQAYKGLESVTTSTVQAVEETRGQVLVRDNQILLTEYAASDALTRSAHRGQGMSQDGAQARAELGWSYLEILGDYYRNAGIALLPEGFARLR